MTSSQHNLIHDMQPTGFYGRRAANSEDLNGPDLMFCVGQYFPVSNNAVAAERFFPKRSF